MHFVRSFLVALLFLSPLVCLAEDPDSTPTPTNTPTTEITTTVTPTPTPTPENEATGPGGLQCVLVADATLRDLTAYAVASSNLDYLGRTFDQVQIGTSNLNAYTATLFEDRVGFRAYCGYPSKSESYSKTLSARWKLKSEFKESCSDATAAGVCAEFNSLPIDGGQDIEIKGRILRFVGGLVLRNLNSADAAIASDDIKLRLGEGASAVEYSLVGGLKIAGTRTLRCEITMTGVTSGTPFSKSCTGTAGCDPEYANEVSNTQLRFRASIVGRGYSSFEPKQVSYISSPTGVSETGRWDTPPINTDVRVTAVVEALGGRVMSCSIRFRASGDEMTVKLRKGGTCSLFKDLRQYYYTDPTGKVRQDTGYPKALEYPGMDPPVYYGKNVPEIPFTGVMNSSTRVGGALELGVGGTVSLPPIDKRLFDRSVIVAYPYLPENSGSQIGPPAFWAYLNPNDYSSTRLAPVSADRIPADTTQMVFMLYAAHAQRNPGSQENVRHTPGKLQYWEFTPTVSRGLPFDKVIPLFNASCPVVFRMPMLARSDKPEMPASMASAALCAFSKPFSMGDFRAGRVALDVLHIAPQGPRHVYPSDLLRSSRQAPCRAETDEERNDLVDCWNANPADLPPKSSGGLTTNHRECVEYNWTGTEWAWIVHQMNCPVMEGSECEKTIAYRVAWREMEWGAALGCAAKYNWSGTPISALIHFANWRTASPSNYGGTGYGCIYCRNASQAAATGHALGADNNWFAFTFTKTKRPRKCVVDTDVAMRHWGASVCDDHRYHPEAGCDGRSGTTSCPSENEGGFSAGGNVLGKFTVPLCPGSQMEFDSVSLSWSPLLLDVGGRGFEVSRDFERAVSFDIRGKGEKNLVDWPINTRDVAFLVRPKDGKVSSIKQLFGDDKAKNGFEALRKYDSNHDGVVDKRDRRFKELALWFDRNRNAIAEPDELETLEAHSVGAIYLDYHQPMQARDERKTLAGTWFNAKERAFRNIADYYFFEYWKGGRRMKALTDNR